MLRKLERKLGRYAIPNLIMLLVAGQAAAFVLSLAKPEMFDQLTLVPELVLRGQVWRVVSFLFTPPSSSPIWAIISLLAYFSFGRALESDWGDFRFNVFVFVGWLATLAAAFAFPGSVATNRYLMWSLVLAFAALNPDAQLLLVIIPVRAKWIGWLTWAYLAVIFVLGAWSERALIAAGVLNYFLFFGRDLGLRLRSSGRRRVRQREQQRTATAAMHTCAVCGITDVEDPKMQFRYCSQCGGKRGYCMDHIRDHEHVKG